MAGRPIWFWKWGVVPAAMVILDVYVSQAD
jgi:hypothetical protein